MTRRHVGPEFCSECPDNGRYCAPARCYCGHPSCPAYPTWFNPWRDVNPVSESR